MTGSKFEEFTRELEHFDTAMLVTRSADRELRSRPMAIAGFDDDMRVWFITDIDSAKLAELTEFPAANVALQAGKRFMSISGTVRATRDPELVRRFWHEDQRVWFEQGRDDPRLVLLELTPTYAEYWDRAGAEAVRFALAEAKAIINRETLSGDETRHAKLELQASSSSRQARAPGNRGRHASGE